MQSPFLDRAVSNFGTYQMLTPPFQEAAKNSSHLQELYQNLPQLQKQIFLPVTYKSYQPQNSLLDAYAEQQHPSLSLSPSLLYSKLQSSNHNGKFRYTKHRLEPELDKDQIMNKRNGWGWDAGHGQHGHQHKHGNSPALSALALLGFMFFLNLIQNSLQNNRQMLAAAALNATTISVVAGRENPYGYNRYRRSIDEQSRPLIPVAAPQYMMRDGDVTDKNNLHKEKVNRKKDRTKFMHGVNSSWSTSKKIGKVQLNKNSNPIELLKSSSVHCCQLVACKLGESIFDSLDATTGFMIRMLGSTIITRVSKKTWTGRLLRALDKGWKKESCNNSFKNCFVWYKLFNNATNTIGAKEPTRGEH